MKASLPGQAGIENGENISIQILTPIAKTLLLRILGDQFLK
jgi:hypothetical protein